MESFLFKASVTHGFSLGGRQLFTCPKTIVEAADRLMVRMHRGSIVSIKVARINRGGF